MMRRFLARMILTCYGAIALCGQGLHCCVAEHGHAHPASDLRSDVAALDSPDDDCHHDSDTCSICQHHSLGQIVALPVPVENGLDVCQAITPIAPQAVFCVAHFSPAQPRAPPAT